MRDREGNKRDKKVQVTTEMSIHELQRLHSYLHRSGLKKGFFIRAAILEKLDRDETRRGDCEETA